MKWGHVRSPRGLSCEYGDFIPMGEQALFGAWRPDRPRMVVCVVHAKQYYQMEPPARSFTSSQPDDVVDVRAKQAGD